MDGCDIGAHHKGTEEIYFLHAETNLKFIRCDTVSMEITIGHCPFENIFIQFPSGNSIWPHHKLSDRILHAMHRMGLGVSFSLPSTTQKQTTRDTIYQWNERWRTMKCVTNGPLSGSSVTVSTLCHVRWCWCWAKKTKWNYRNVWESSIVIRMGNLWFI